MESQIGDDVTKHRRQRACLPSGHIALFERSAIVVVRTKYHFRVCVGGQVTVGSKMRFLTGAGDVDANMSVAMLFDISTQLAANSTASGIRRNRIMKEFLLTFCRKSRSAN
jgi:hypothetical protein